MSPEDKFVCSMCKVLKARGLFARSKQNKRGLDYYCKECRKSVKRRPSVLAAQQRCVDARREERNAYSRAYSKAHRGYFNAQHKKYMGRKTKATPPWLSEEHLQEMQDMYWLAQDLKATSGETYHVDHIVPLQGKNVCGLHVPWNLQVLPSDLNLRKSNKF